MQMHRFLLATGRKGVSRIAGVLLIACLLSTGLMATAWAGEPDIDRAELALLASRFEEPLIPTAPTSPAEDAALLQAIQAYNGQAEKDSFQPFQGFLSDHPGSGWQVALLTNLGLSYYHYGFFSKAIDAWEQAWRAGRDVTELHGKALVDRDVGELLRMHARLGHSEQLAALFKDIGDRSLTGPATEARDGATEGLWVMQHDPGVAYLCGPMALKNLLLALGKTESAVGFLDKVRSGPQGVSLAEIAHLADEAKLEYRLVHRNPDEPVPVPSIVHWKVSHFAAIVSEQDGRFHVQDPTFGQDLWITRAALDSEASGFFLVPGKPAQSPWREAREEETANIRGMGYTGSIWSILTRLFDSTAQSAQCTGNPGMCGYAFTEVSVNLRLQDMPVGYVPPKGPSAQVSVTYNQREASQPSNFSFFNVSPKWTLNWLTYVSDDPNRAGNNVTRYVAGGGSVIYTGYASSTGAFTPETHDASVLVRSSATPITYQRNLPDGSIEVYGKSNGATSYPRLVFLTKKTDPYGNSVTLNYDSLLRLTSIVDATGRSTTFAYGSGSQALLVTKIADPFGRQAELAYDSSGRLSQITDVLGLTSRFSYDSNSLVNALTTPYGTTSFVYGDNGNSRYLQATDPLGHTERLEYLQQAPGIPFSDPANTVPVGIVNPFNQYLTGRDTFYWDKHAYAVAAGDYTKARNRHWTHLASNTSVTANTIESIQYPLENRIWFNYPGQAGTSLGTALSGTLDKPINIGRVLDDGSTQLTQMQYNSFGNVTSIIDPVGRQTTFQHAANQIDVTTVQQKSSASGFSPIAQFTYNGQHLPLTYTDAAGQVTTFAYNTAGQLIERKDALGFLTTYQYNGLGYLTSVINANGKTALTLAYDGQGRVAATTDSEGLVVRYAYDAMDRLTQATYMDGTTRTYTWNRLDLATVRDRQGRVTNYAYDAVRNLVAVTDPIGELTKLGYFENQVPKTLTDPNGHITSWAIDLESRVTAKTYPDGHSLTDTYENTTSRLKSVRDGLGQTTQYSYTMDNRLIGVQYLNAVNATPKVVFTYDPFFPRIASMADGSGATSYTYQPVGVLGALQLAQENGPFANTAIQYQYDALGRLSNRSVGGNAESWGYDALGRLTSHADDLGTFALSYLGQTNQITGQNASAVGTEWNYDTNLNDRRLLAITNAGNARSYRYTTTPEHDITGISEMANGATQQIWSYSYDAADRLLTASSSSGAQYSYGYDPASNIRSNSRPTGFNTFSSNSANQITSLNGKPFIYDANGNLLQDDLRTYQWDAANRLISISYKTEPGVSTTLQYDGLSRRIDIANVNGSLTSESRYLWCGQTLCQARNTSDAVTRRYFVEGEELPGTNSLLYYATDQLGSVRDVLTAQSGSDVSTSDYEPYGPQTLSTGQVSTDFRYAGLFYNQQSGLYFSTLRVYDGRTGRWLTRDPIAESGSLNLYSYVEGNPVSFIDVIGLCSTTNNSEDDDKCKDKLNDMLNDIQATRQSGTSDPKGLIQRFRQLTNYRDPDVLRGHIIQFQNRQRNLQSKIDDYINSGCGDPPALVREWADKQIPDSIINSNQNQGTFFEIGGGLGGGYILYRVVRLLPSLLPPLWETLPPNLAYP